MKFKISSLIKRKHMLPGDYKRKYRFRTDTSKEQKIVNIAIILSIIFVIAYWIFG